MSDRRGHAIENSYDPTEIDLGLERATKLALDDDDPFGALDRELGTLARRLIGRQRSAQVTTTANGTMAAGQIHNQYCQLANGQIVPYQDIGGFMLIPGDAPMDIGVGQAVNRSAMPTIRKFKGIAGGGRSGKATSQASVTLRGLTGGVRNHALRPLTGTASIGGSIGKALPYLGALQMYLDYLSMLKRPSCRPIA